MAAYSFKDMLYVMEHLYCGKELPAPCDRKIAQLLRYLERCGLIERAEDRLRLTPHGADYYEGVSAAVRELNGIKDEMTRRGW